MRHILRRREWLADEWRYLGEDSDGADGAVALIVPFAQLRADPQKLARQPRSPGRAPGSADRVEELAPELPHLSLVAVQFPNPGDGRGYTQGRLLRERFGFTGELRAVGAGVRQDQVFLLARCGFDALELAAGEDPQAA